ncbi:protein PXR1-like [Syzygium oleosum]|uniref:protein PXR1-like n=1 Tax=Syzygium oleosum TaxID=219896 RepID=UPI0024BA1240|nr:protein PXR1-like [Syzygium oleosum]
MAKQQKAEEGEELHYAEKEIGMKTEEITKDGEKVLNEEKKECHGEIGDKLEEDEENKKEEKSKEIVDGQEKGKEEKEERKKKKKKKKPKTAQEEEEMYKDIGMLKQKLEKINYKIEALLEKKAFISRKLKEAEAKNGETSEKPGPKEVAAADGA